VAKFSHFDEAGNTHMVDVSNKDISLRLARAVCLVRMKPETQRLIREQAIKKGDVLETARLAGIMGCKTTSQLIPLCHPISIDSVELLLEFVENSEDDVQTLRIESTVKSTGRTGVEMEALTSVSVAALTVYDMCKSVDREMEISLIHLVEKSGGKSGHFKRDNSHGTISNRSNVATRNKT